MPSPVVTTGDLISAADWNEGSLGVLDRSTASNNQTGIGTSPTDLTDLSITVNVVANRLIRVVGHVFVQQKTGAGVVQVQIHQDGTEIQRIGHPTLAANEFAACEGSRLLVPSEGSHTYKLVAQTSSDTVDALAALTRPNQIIAEDVGAA